MKKSDLPLLLFLFLILASCAEKKSELIAIDVLLTLPDDVYQEAVTYNSMILEENSENFSLDEDHIPHITLLQCYVAESNLKTIEKALDGLTTDLKKMPLIINELQYNSDKPQSFSSLGIEKTEALIKLHEQTIALLIPFMVANASREAYVPDKDGTPIDAFTLAYVPKFVAEHSYAAYNPHISLGVASLELLDSLAQHHFKERKFHSPSIEVFQLGNYGTARKKLWKVK